MAKEKSQDRALRTDVGGTLSLSVRPGPVTDVPLTSVLFGDHMAAPGIGLDKP